MRQRLTHRRYSPAATSVLVAAGSALVSYEEAAKLAALASDLKISARHLQTLCQEVGQELTNARSAKTKTYRARPLAAKAIVAQPPVPLAAVMVDGGRMQTRKPDCGTGVHEAAWRETKAAVLLRMTHTEHEEDPRPNLPECFAQPMSKPAQESTKHAENKDRTRSKKKRCEADRKAPHILFRTGLATLENSEAFGWMTAATAEERGFFSAKARAFVADGQAYNWSIQRQHFRDFEPILDFMHAAEHLHEAAAGCGEGDSALGRRWVEMCWQGCTSDVLLELRNQQAAHAPPVVDPASENDHPWCVLERVYNYLNHNQERMDYPRYRRAGLPITSSHVESWIKQINRRVKGSEKFWNDNQDAEAVLQLRAAWLSEGEPLQQHLKSRPGNMYARPQNRLSEPKAA